MKIKELQKTVNVAWSPAQQQTILLAAGTAAQQLDASSSAVLEIYETNLAEPGYDLVLKSSQTSPYRFHKLVWSPLGYGGQYGNGVIVAGCESGHLQVYDAAKLLAGEEAIMSTQEKHTGPIRALDINPFQTNLLASGAAESEILIWDLNNTATPMTPGTKTQPFEDIQNVGWNKQVQHILASVFSTRCVVWDLRKNEPIIKLSDSQSRVRWRSLQWHPEIATQLWLASEEDQAPVVQLWDLRYATSPAKTIQIHQRGILGLSWCARDIDLMISCGKDNRILCWNPNAETPGDEILSEIASTIQWYSDVQWCPRNPALMAASSLEGNVSIYSLFGGSQQQVQTSNKIADSFPGMDTFAQAPVPQSTAASITYSDLRKPPKWMKRPIGAKFGFGGKLVSFNATSKAVIVNQVITEPELVGRSSHLEEVLANGNYEDYCRQKADQMTDQNGRYIWYFLKANFDANPQTEMLNLLGYSPDDMEMKFGKYLPKDDDEQPAIGDSVDKGLGPDSSEVDDPLSSDATTDTSEIDNDATFDAIAADHQQKATNITADNGIPYKIKTDDDAESLICQALLTGKTEAAVELCLKNERYADAVIIAMSGGPELLARTQYRYLKKRDGYLANVISALVTDDWSGVVTQCSTDSWKEALVAVLTHAKEQLPDLCDRLGERLHQEGGAASIHSAILCFICAGNVEKLVDYWPTLDTVAGKDRQQQIADLQELVEIVMLLQKALELQGRNTAASGKLASLLTRYAGLLVAQGALNSALSYLGPSEDAQVVDLRERLYYSLGHKQHQQQQQQRNSYTTAQQQQRTSLPHNRFFPSRGSIPNNSFSTSSLASAFNTSFPGQPTLPAAQPSAQPWIQQPQVAAQNWNQPPALPLQPQTMQPTAAAVPAVGPPITAHPPRPSSVGSQGSAPTVTRSKYLLDPSVQSSSAYGQPPPMNPYQPPATNNGMMYGAGDQISGSGFQPLVPAPMTNQPQFAPFTPATGHFMPGVPPIELAQAAMPAPPQKNSTPPPGWNDPPALKTNRKPAPPPTTDFAQINNTPSMYGGQDMNQMPNGLLDPNAQQLPYQAPPSMMSPALQPQQPFGIGAPSAAAGPPPPMHFQPQAVPIQASSVQQSYQFQPQQPFQPPPQQQQVPPKPQTPEPPKPKPPLPEEYVYMQTVFNELKLQCSKAAANPQTKRKLEDVAKRLEYLYDMLRENRLTPNTLASLNQLVQLVQNGDYANGLGLHTQMVSGPDFSQIASFMPGIKVLLLSAMQLQIFLR